MKIAFVTTQSPTQSTLVGRILPLTTRLAKHQQYNIHILGHQTNQTALPQGITWHSIGLNPFIASDGTKKRLKGLQLVSRLIQNIIGTCKTLKNLNPDVIVIVKPLPQNVAAVSLYSRWLALITQTSPRILLDMDDYELTANQLTSLAQRAAVHWSQQEAHRLARHVIVATPFLQEYSRQLAPHLPRTLIPTSADLPPNITISPNTTSPIILYIGSLSFSSGHRVDLLPDIWQQTIKHFPNAHLRIAGDGHDQAQLQETFHQKSLGSSVTFTGRFTPQDIPELLKDVAVIIDPIDANLTNRAKSSYRASLAAFMGLPYLSSNIGIRPVWFPESFHDRFFAQPAAVDDYARKLQELINHPLTPEEQIELQTYALRYTWDKLASSYHLALTS